MELRQLITFRTVASTLNFSRAAAALNYVPSNVTMQMQALEAELGVRLFDRLGKQLILTDAGTRFLSYVEQMLNTLDEARTNVCDSGRLTGTVTVSANEILCAYRLPAVFRRFREHYPGIRLIFRPFSNDELKQSLYDGKADVVFFLDEPVRSTGLCTESLLQEPFRLLVAPNHPLLQWKELLPEHFQGELFLLNEKGCTYRTLFERSLAMDGIDSSIHLEFSSAEAIKQCAMAGIGIAFLPEIAAATELERGELIALPWAMPDLRVATQMLWHKEKWLSPAIEAFLETARTTLRP
ncbi:LysR family transcriptional regulator [Paenibacillus tyrfis]|uniref:LysR family transcriptional regulator n=1 Tax=Paenibacillus tyrfis TaxID=1501230 RepID=A0A081P2L3_9BACL|nr:LysR family transcriptional regulator [Paenibacillus tyrfis]KEQ24936.1 LysR family transcriptional regulator [Paenibacillus tyrfis]